MEAEHRELAVEQKSLNSLDNGGDDMPVGSPAMPRAESGAEHGGSAGMSGIQQSNMKDLAQGASWVHCCQRSLVDWPLFHNLAVSVL